MTKAELRRKYAAVCEKIEHLNDEATKLELQMMEDEEAED